MAMAMASLSSPSCAVSASNADDCGTSRRARMAAATTASISARVLLPPSSRTTSSYSRSNRSSFSSLSSKARGGLWTQFSSRGGPVQHVNRRLHACPCAEVSTVEGTELAAISGFSEIVPDTVIFDDFERFPPTAATVSPSLLLGITSIPKARYSSAIDSALAYGRCYTIQSPPDRMSCFLSKALVNVGAELVRLVPGRVSTEVDVRLAYDTPGIVEKVHELLTLYDELEVARDRLLFKISGTWQGIDAARQLEREGTQTHVTHVYSFPQAAAAAQAGVSVIQMFTGRVRDWARGHEGDNDVDAALQIGQDPGIALATNAYNYVHKNGYKSKLMAAAVRNKQDVFSLLGLDYLVVPVKVLQSLQDSKANLDDKYAFGPRLTPSAAKSAHLPAYESCKWDEAKFSEALGPLAEDLLASGVEGNVAQTRRIEDHFSKIWPPPNV